MRGGRQLLDQARVVAAVEVRGRASGRVRLQVVPNASGAALTGFVQAPVVAGAIVRTDGWPGYASLTALGHVIGPAPSDIPPAPSESSPECTGCSATSQPQDLAPGPPSRCRPSVPPRLPGRVHLPVQPAPHPDGRVSDAPGSRHPARTHALQLVVWSGVNRISSSSELTCPSGGLTPSSPPSPLIHAGRAWPGSSQRSFCFRETDGVVHRETRRPPLSVSSDRIAAPAMRAAGVLWVLATSGMLVDRAGRGAVVEVYPAPRLRVAGGCQLQATRDGTARTSAVRSFSSSLRGRSVLGHPQSSWPSVRPTITG